MFSSWTTSFSQLTASAASPKTLLANYLSRQLAEFLDVDASQIESNLVTDAHIKLQKVKIRPYPLVVIQPTTASTTATDHHVMSTVVMCQGIVDSIEFQWTWGTGFGQGAQAYIKDVQLHVRGVHLRIYQTTTTTTTTTTTAQTKPPSAAAAAETTASFTTNLDWKARYFQQILDHLTLALDSIRISIELPTNRPYGNHSDSTKFVLCIMGEKMELVTLGGSSSSSVVSNATATSSPDPAENSGLRQRFSLGSLSAVIQQTNNSNTNNTSHGDAATTTTTLPLLDPVAYRAMVKRVSGRRFVDGIGAGLVILGERILAGIGSSTTTGGGPSGQTSSNQAPMMGNGLQLHAGIPQVTCLLQLQKMFAFGNQATNTSTTATTTTATPIPVSDETKSSLFSLPVEYMALVLDKGTTVRIQPCVVTLRTDGSVFHVQSPTGDIWVDDRKVNHTREGSWQVDLIHSKITVKSRDDVASTSNRTNDINAGDEKTDDTFYDSEQEEEALTDLRLDVNQCRRIYQGLHAIMNLFDSPDPHDPVTPWTFEVRGKAIMSLTSCGQEQTATCILVDPRVEYIGSNESSAHSELVDLPCLFSWNSIKMQSKDLGNAIIRIPKNNNVGRDGRSMSFSDAITCRIDSIDASQQALTFVNEVAKIMEGGESTGVPLKIIIPAIALHIRKEMMDIQAKVVEISGYDVSVASIDAAAASSPSSDKSQLSAQNLTCNWKLYTDVSIEKISSASFGDTMSLAAPTQNVFIKYTKDLLTVGPITSAIIYKPLPTESMSRTNCSFNFLWDLEITMPISIDLKDITVYETTTTNILASLRSARGTACTVNGKSTVSLVWDAMTYHGLNLEGGKCQMQISKESCDTSISLASLGYSDSSVGSIQADGIGIKGKLKPSSSSKDCVQVPGIGVLTEASVNVASISAASLVGTGALTQPLVNTSLELMSGVLSVKCGHVHVSLDQSSSAMSGSESTGAFWDVKLFLPVNLSIQGLTILSSLQQTICFQITSIRVKGKSEDNMNNIKMEWESVSAMGFHAFHGKSDVLYGDKHLKASLEIPMIQSSNWKEGIVEAKGIRAGAKLSKFSSSDNGIKVEQVGFAEELELSVLEVPLLTVHGVFTLSSPLDDFSFVFKNGYSEVKLGTVDCTQQVFPGDNSGSQVASVQKVRSEKATPSLADYGGFFVMPCNISIRSFRFQSEQDSPPLDLGFMNMSLRLEAIKPNSPHVLSFSVSSLLNLYYLKMVKIPSLQLQGCLDLRKPDVVHSLGIAMHELRLSADFSSVKWSDALFAPSKGSSPPVPLPFVQVSEFNVIMNGKGRVIALKDTVLRLNRFKGNEKTDSKQLVEHYIQLVKKRIPYLLSITEVLGTNIGDSVSSVATAVAMKSTVVGSLAGVGIRDGVGGAISLGKQARGADKSERYHFGDFTRGAVASVGLAAHQGSSMRGSDKYSVGDFSRGAASATAEYSSKNRDRLGGAAGSTAAMVAGAAIAGPIGLVAGSIIGNMAGRKAVKATVGEYKGKAGSMQTQAPEQNLLSFDTGGPGQSNPAAPRPATNRVSNAPEREPISARPLRQVAAPVDQTLPQTSPDLFSNDHGSKRSVDDPFDVFNNQQGSIAPSKAAAPRQSYDDPFAVFEQPTPTTTSLPKYAPHPNDPLGLLVSQSQTESTAPYTVASSHLVPQPTSVANPTATRSPAVTSINPPSQQQQYQHYQHHSNPPSHSSNPPPQQQQRSVAQARAAPSPPAGQQQQGYKFGDFTRGVIARGKEKRGGNSDGSYKFGDFSRGLFGK